MDTLSGNVVDGPPYYILDVDSEAPPEFLASSQVSETPARPPVVYTQTHRSSSWSASLPAGGDEPIPANASDNDPSDDQTIYKDFGSQQARERFNVDPSHVGSARHRAAILRIEQETAERNAANEANREAWLLEQESANRLAASRTRLQAIRQSAEEPSVEHHIRTLNTILFETVFDLVGTASALAFTFSICDTGNMPVPTMNVKATFLITLALFLLSISANLLPVKAMALSGLVAVGFEEVSRTRLLKGTMMPSTVTMRSFDKRATARTPGLYFLR